MCSRQIDLEIEFHNSTLMDKFGSQLLFGANVEGKLLQYTASIEQAFVVKAFFVCLFVSCLYSV